MENGSQSSIKRPSSALNRLFGRYHGVRRGSAVHSFAMASVETREMAGVTLTEAAASKVRELMAQEPAGEAEELRVAIQGGDCGGFEYQLGFDRGATAEDAEF